MLFSYLGDQALFVGVVARMGVVWVQMGIHEARTIGLRRNLNRRLPCRRLSICGEHYVH